MSAAGAMACAHSTSIDVSSAQAAFVRGYVLVLPDALTFRKQRFAVMHFGRPN